MASAFTLEKRIEIVKKGEEYQKNDTPMSELYNKFSIAQPTYYKYRREIKKRLEKLGYNYDELINSKNPEEIKNLILEGEKNSKKVENHEVKENKIITEKPKEEHKKEEKKGTSKDDDSLIEEILKEINQPKKEEKKEVKKEVKAEEPKQEQNTGKRHTVPFWIWIALGGVVISIVVVTMNIKTNKEIKQLKTTMESKEQKKKSNDPFANYITF